MSETNRLYEHAKSRIPGGVGLLSKSPEQFAPGQWPAYFSKAKGCEVWDLDGNHYYDMTTNGIGACLLGFADEDVEKTVCERTMNGSMCSQNPPEEVWLADRLCEIHPWAECVRYARTGGETCAVAVRIARATTGRDLVAICGYHGWSDWYLAANLSDDHSLDGQLLPGLKPLGLVRGLTGTALTFNYDSYEEFDEIIARYGDRLACVIMEPVRNYMPDGNFIRHVRDEIHRVGGLLIVDEITIGWRLTFGGSHKLLGITPDIATFGKAIANGHPMGAVIGTRAAMDGANDSFISSTFWTESIGPAAALTTLDKIEKTRAWEYLTKIGTAVQRDWKETAEAAGVDVDTSGLPCLARFSFTGYEDDEDKLVLKTLYTALMLKEGYLGGTGFYPTLAHNDEILSAYREAMFRVFDRIGKLLKQGGIEAARVAIGGPVCIKDFKRLIR